MEKKIQSTALFGKVYRTMFQGIRRRPVFKTGIIMYIPNDTRKYFLVYIFTNICICYKIKT